jgi:hypothetical protein
MSPLLYFMDLRMLSVGADFDWKKLRPFVTPVALLVTSGVLAYAASWFAGSVANSLTKIAVFAAVALLTIHVTFFVCRWATDDVALKLVDYIYLAIAFGSLGAVVDLQIAAFRYESYDFMPQSIERLETLRKNCVDPETAHIFVVGCRWQEEVLQYVRGGAYDHMTVGMKLQSYDKSKAELEPLHGEFFEELRSLWQGVEALREEYGLPSDRDMGWWKLFFIYMFCVGAVIRLSKVTAELFNWRVKKQTSWDW